MAVTEQVLILLKAKDEASKVINGVADNVNGLAKVAGTAVKLASAAAVAAVGGVTAAIGVGVKKAADLEQGVADIASVMGITFDQAAPLKKLIGDLGMDPKLKVNAVEASDAIMQLAQSGMSMQEILDGAARSTVLLSNATGGDMATSAAIASDAMALFGINATDMATAVNGITGVTVASKFGINDYQLALSQAGGVASAVGVNFADFNTTIAAISPYFASGSDAGTSFKTFLQRLVPITNDAESAMKALGLITADGANQFFNADGTMRGMSEISGLLATALAGLTEEQKNVALSTIFGTDAMRAAVGLAEAGTGKFDELATSIASIDAEASAATRMDTFSGSLEILQGIIDGLLTQIGDAFLPLLRDLAQWATDFATTHGPAVVAWFGNLAQWFRDQQPVIKTWTERVFGALNEVMAWLRGERTDFNNLKTLWNGVAEMISGMVQRALQYIVENTPRWIAALMSWAQLAASWAVTLWDVHVWPGLQQFWTNMSTWLDANAGGLGTALTAWATEFSTLTSNIINGWQIAWPEIATIVAESAGAIGEDLNRILDSLTRISRWFSGGEGDAAVNSWSEFFTKLVNVASVPLSGLVHVFANIIDIVAMLGDLFGALGAADWGKAGDIAQRIAGTFGDTVWTALSTPAGIIDAIQGRAAGGPVRGDTPYWVGEMGPELFVPDRSGTIVPNNQTSNTTNNYTVNLQGSGNAGNDVLASLRLVSAMYG